MTSVLRGSRDSPTSPPPGFSSTKSSGRLNARNANASRSSATALKPLPDRRTTDYEDARLVTFERGAPNPAAGLFSSRSRLNAGPTHAARVCAGPFLSTCENQNATFRRTFPAYLSHGVSVYVR